MSPLQNRNSYSVTNSTDFTKKLINTTIDDDEITISFDVVSLFTAIPVDRASERIRNKLKQDNTLRQRSKLSIDDIIKLLRFTLSNSYFTFNNETYKQIHGCAMGSPVSPIVANLCMEEIEELAFCQTDTPPKKWFRFMDVFSIIKKHAITNFHNLLNSIDPHINFTTEHEQNGQLSFLDTIVTRNNGSLIVNVYRKLTHTDRYLDYSSHHDKQHKISTARTLLHRAAHLPYTNEGKQQEKHHVLDALRNNGYPKIFLDEVEKRRARKTEIVPSPEELVRMFFENVEPKNNSSYAVLPYINGITEPLKRLLKRHDIRTTTKTFPVAEGQTISRKTDQCRI